MKLTDLRGINEKRAKDFAGLGIGTTAELARYYPRSYLDMTSRVSVREVFKDLSPFIGFFLLAST